MSTYFEELEENEEYISPCCRAEVYDLGDNEHCACKNCESSIHYEDCIVEIM